MKYNFIILGSEWDLYKHSYSSLFHLDNVQYIAGCNPNPKTLIGLLYRFHFNIKINKFINLPLKKIWNRFYIKSNFKNDENLCIIIFNNWIVINVDIIQYLRTKYPKAKLVWFCQDLISTERLLYTDSKFDVNQYKRLCDITISFDPGDCNRYGFLYHSLVFSPYISRSFDNKSDIYFLGKAKNRLNDVVKIYDFCSNLGLLCKFYIVGVSKEARINREHIHYIDGMSYYDNLDHIVNSHCILELLQTGATGYTQRVCEAVCLNKLLITNNKNITLAPFYNDKFISVINDNKEINLDFLQSISFMKANYDCQDQFAPQHLLEFIESLL